MRRKSDPVMLKRQLWVPAQRIPPDFSRWLRQNFNRNLILGWHSAAHRYVLGSTDRKGDRYIVAVLERPDGSFMPLGEEAKRFIKASVRSGNRFVRDHKRKKRMERDLREAEDRAFRDDIHYAFKEDQRILFGGTQSAFPTNPLAKAKKG